MKKSFFLILAIMLLLSFIFVGCTTPAASPSPTPTPAPAPGASEPAPEGGPPGMPPMPPPPPPLPEGAIELRLSTHIPPFAPPVKLYQEWGQKLLEATNNQAGITVFAAGSLVSQQDMVSGTRSGITDIGEIIVDWFQEDYPLSTILALPFIPVGNHETAMKIWNELEAKYPEIKAENNDFKVLVKVSTVTPALHTTNKQVRVPQDVKGLKLMSSGSQGEVMESLGASALQLAVPDWYTSLERGLCDGLFMEWGALVETNVYELLPYHTVIPSSIGVGMGMFIMNLDSWNKLPPDVQKALDDLSVWMTEANGKMNEERIAAAFATLEKAEGHTTITLTPEEDKLWLDVALPIHQKRIAEVEAMGLPAQAVYDDIMKLCEEYSK